MRHPQAIIAAILVVFCFSSCKLVDQSLELAVCGSYAVPGMMCFELKGDAFTCDIIETDTFGRILFSYSAYSHIEQKNSKYYVICQRIDAKKVFYYEDTCFARYTDSLESLQVLKDANDWNKPLVEGKMSARPIIISADLFLQTDIQTDIKIVKKGFCRSAGISADCITDSFIIDANDDGQSLYLFYLNDKGVVQQYLVLCDQDYNICWTILSNNANYMEKLIEFKQQNGWFYPDI